MRVARAPAFGHVRTLVAADFRNRYARSLLGIGWVVVHPLATVVVLTIVLSGVLAARIPGSGDTFGFALYLMSGLALWNVFAETVSRCLTVFTEQAELIRKTSITTKVFPMAVTVSAGLSGLVFFFLVIGAGIFFGPSPGLHLAWLPVLFAITLLLAGAVGTILGVFNVFLRDTGQVVAVCLQFLFWSTPIVYTINMVPPAFRPFFELNPLAHLVGSAQAALVSGSHPSFFSLAYPTVLATTALLAAGALLRRAAPDLEDGT